jgi:hypothetical protein
MTNSKLILTASVAVLMLGAASCAATAAERGAPARGPIVIAADDSAPGSAKTGEDAGPNTGEDQGAAPEDDTQKATGSESGEDDQDDVMPPAEDEDEGAPADDSKQDE